MFYSFGFFQHPLCRFLNVLKSLANSLISQSEDRMLGVIENVLWFILLFQSFGGDFVRDVHTLAEQRFAPDDLGELHDACDMGQTVGEVCQKQDPARTFKRVVSAKLFGDENGIDFRAALE